MEELREAMKEWLAAYESHEKACSQFDVDSWDYSGRDRIERLEKAGKGFETAFLTIIDERVAAALAEKKL